MASRHSRPRSLLIGAVRALFLVASDDPGLTRSQVEAFTAQLPALYVLVFLNTCALAATHIGIAPAGRAGVLPAILGLACLWRAAEWRRQRRRPLSHESAVRKLQSTVWLAGALGFIFAVWSLSLFSWGGTAVKCQTVFFTALTTVPAIFCLMHLRQAALALALGMVVPFSIYFLSSGDPVLIVIVLNLWLVLGGMMFIVNANYDTFFRLIAAQAEIERKHHDTRRLGDDNLRLAHCDSLTQLPNRRRFFSELDAVRERASGRGARFVVGLIDLDGFKPINDVYGHVAGDQVLIETSVRMQLFAGDDFFFARLGGDEFGFLIDADLSGPAITERLAGLHELLHRPHLISDSSASVSASIGVATYPEAGTTAAALFERADYALYHAKQNCRGTTVLFSRDHEIEIRKASTLEQELCQADLPRDLDLAYQPLVDAETGRTIGFEALARWRSPTLGAVPASTFIRIAERSELIGRITLVLLQKALDAAAEWPEHIRISFNLSARDVASSAVVEEIRRIIAASPVSPERIDLEVTETILMQNLEQAEAALRLLKTSGVRISLDDFGTGFSSLSYVHQLPFDKLKVDRGFVGGVVENRASRNVIRTVVDLCRNLSLDCVIEGVETQAERDALRTLGCSVMQGYLFSRPMPREQVALWLAGERRRPACARGLEAATA